MAKNNLNGWSLTLLRVVLGIIFTYHGYMKLFAPGGFTGTVQFFASIGIPLAPWSALVAALVEFVGGLALIAGMLTKLSTGLLIIEMLVAFFKVHIRNGFFIGMSYGYEFVLLILASLVVLMASGAGKLSLGKLFRKKFLK